MDKGKQRSALLQVRDFIWTALVNGSALAQKKDDVPLSLSGEFAIAGYEFWWVVRWDVVLKWRCIDPEVAMDFSYIVSRSKRAALFNLLGVLEENIVDLTEEP